MSAYHEGYQLTMDEIAAVVSLAGKQSMFGFQSEEIGQLTAEKLWDACCGMLRDNMLTQIGGKFRLNGELATVMRAICEANTVLSLMPGSDLHAQVLFYVADTVTAVERTPFGRYVLRAAAPEDLADIITEHMELTYPETAASVEWPPETALDWDAPQQTLLSGALFLVERLDAAQGKRTGWLRVTEQGVMRYLQWVKGTQLHCEPLTKDALTAALQMLL